MRLECFFCVLCFSYCFCLFFYFFFFKQKTAYEIVRCLEFRRVLFRSHRVDRGGFTEGTEKKLAAGSLPHQRRKAASPGACGSEVGNRLRRPPAKIGLWLAPMRSEERRGGKEWRTWGVAGAERKRRER